MTRGDRVLVAQGYGHTPGGDPIGQHTPMAVASVSKSFTALAVMQLVEARRVGIDWPVRVYLPEFTLADSRADQVTVRQLLNQTSGLLDLEIFPLSAAGNRIRCKSSWRVCAPFRLPRHRDPGGITTIPITRLPRAWLK